jgi:type IV secretion system protein VirB9
MKWKIKFSIIILFLSIFGVVKAEPSVQVIHSQEGQVYSLTMSLFYVTSIHFQGTAPITSIHCGDSSAWEVLRSKVEKNSILIKPLIANSETDLIVRMNNRTVLFKIKSSNQKTITPLIFVNVMMPSDSVQIEKMTLDSPTYCFHGDESLRPLWMYDNGSYTYFSWPVNTAFPAVYRLSGDMKQSYLTNFRINKQTFLLPGISEKWLLKRGGKKAILSRSSYRRGFGDCHG